MKIHVTVEPGTIVTNVAPAITEKYNVLELSDAGIHPCEYEEMESFRITKLFIENRERMLDRLQHVE